VASGAGTWPKRSEHRSISRWSWAKHMAAAENPARMGLLRHPDGAFTFTSDLLRGTPAQGSAGAIEDSYERVQKGLTRPD
jgi:hypothetical protein